MSHLKSDSPPAVDLIVVLYGSLRHVEGLAEGIEAQTYPREMVRLFFVDNGSDDGALDALAARFGAWPGGLRLLPLRDNPGFAAGNNRAIVAGESPFVLLLNPDTRMATGCLERLVARAEAEPRSGCVEARQVPHEHSKAFEPETGRTSWCVFGCALLRRAALDEAGLLQEWLFLYCEDVDLCWRLWSAGWACLYEPAAAYEHFTGPPEAHSSPALVKYSYRNAVYLRRVYGSALRAWGWAGFWAARSLLSPYLRAHGGPLREGLRMAWRERRTLAAMARQAPSRGWWVGFGLTDHRYGPPGIG